MKELVESLRQLNESSGVYPLSRFRVIFVKDWGFRSAWVFGLLDIEEFGELRSYSGTRELLDALNELRSTLIVDLDFDQG